MANHYYYYALKIITLGQLGEAMPDDPSRDGEAVPDEQILLWEQKVSPERSQRPFRSIVGKAIAEVILEEVPPGLDEPNHESKPALVEALVGLGLGEALTGPGLG